MCTLLTIYIDRHAHTYTQTVEQMSHDFFLICKHTRQFKVVLLVTQMGTLNREFCWFWNLVCFHLGSVGRDSVREEAGGGDGDLLGICNSCEQQESLEFKCKWYLESWAIFSAQTWGANKYCRNV